jgi:putative peptidoglycan lipid II flippase
MDSQIPPISTSPNPAQNTKGLLGSSLIVASMTMLSRVLGLARDVVIATLFGAGSHADAFFVAFKIPNFLRRLFAEGAFNQAFVPVLAGTSEQGNKQLLQAMISRVSGTLLLVLTMVTVVAVIAAPILALIFAPGFADDGDKLGLTADMLRITFPYLLLISMTGFLGSLLNYSKRFVVPAVTPVLLNLSLIGAAIWLAPVLTVPIMALAWGVLIAGVLQVLLQLPFVAQLGLLVRPSVAFGDAKVKQVMQLMLPAMFGVSVAQVNLLLDTVLASMLQSGSVSWLYYSDRLMELPLGVFGIAIATVILPGLSKRHATKSPQAFSDTLDWALRMVLLLGVPAAVALVLLAEPLIAVLFHYGAMGSQDVLNSAASLRAYAFGLLFFMLIKVLAPGYFARLDMKTPVRIGIWAMVSNMLLNLLLVWHFDHVGLAMATSLSALLNASLLGFGLYRKKIWQPSPGWPVFILRMVVGNMALAAVLYFTVEAPQIWLSWGLWERIFQLSQVIIFGGLAYAFGVLICGLRMRHLQGPKDS